MSRPSVVVLTTVLVVGAALGGGAWLARAAAPAPPRHGMMGGAGMAADAFGGPAQTGVTTAGLKAVHDRIEQRLAASGYHRFAVAEIMAFADNDYVLVEDASGQPAFELLADPTGRALMPEPQSMLWNTRYGMSWRTGPGSAVPTAAAAKARADAWLAAHRPGERAADATALPGYFTIDVAKDGATVGMLSVNGRSGAVWFHAWHGAFLADHDF